MTTMMANNDSDRSPTAGRDRGTGAEAERAADVDGDEVVRLGDEHLKGAPSLCVGESQ